MSKYYSEEMLDIPAKGQFGVIIQFFDNSVAAGRLHKGYCLVPFTINEPCLFFKRSHVRRVIYLSNGLVLPKEKKGKQVTLDIIELNDLINRAGYEFI